MELSKVTAGFSFLFALIQQTYTALQHMNV